MGPSAPAMAPRRSARTLMPSVRLRPLPDHAVRGMLSPRAAPAAAPPLWPRHGHRRRLLTRGVDLAVAAAAIRLHHQPGGQLVVQQPRRPGGARGSPTKGEGLPPSERPPQRAVVERAMTRYKTCQAWCGYIRTTRFSVRLGRRLAVREGRRGEGGWVREVARYLLDDQGLVWYLVRVRITRKPSETHGGYSCPARVGRLYRLSALPTRAPRNRKVVFITARPFPLVRYVYGLERVCPVLRLSA